MTFRRKLLVFGVMVAAVTAVAIFFAGGVLIRRSVADRVTERLANEAHLLAKLASRDPALLPAGERASNDPDDFADEAGRSLGLRVTIIASDGTVLGDSSRDGEDLRREESHGTRPEILAAQRDGVGSAVRRGGTVEDDLYYLARRVDREGITVGYVRLAVPTREIRRVTGGYSLTLGAISFLILLAVAAAGYAAARRVSQPIEEMSRTADAIAAGRHDLQVEYESGDEVGRLGSAFNRMTHNLSEQIRALSSEKRLRDTILGGMKEGLLVVDRERRVLLCNDALRWLLGLRGFDPSGRPLLEVVRDEAVVAAFDKALGRGEECRVTARAAGPPVRSFDVTVAPLSDASGVQIGAIGILSDVTRLAALESVRRDFVGDVSHELRTPLTSIKAFVETLLAGGLEDPSNNRRFLEIIKKHSDRMEAILDDLTDLSLIETGAVKLEMERIDLFSIGRDLVDSLRPKGAVVGVGLDSTVTPGTTVLADRRRLEQVLLNLLDNAVKFNRPGGTVTLSAARDGAEGGVRIEVRDTGIGIPSESLDRIFHRFYRVDRARSREMGGTGLGLSIVKHLMNLHGGSIRVESEQGRGSRFILEFPDESRTTRS